MNSYYYLFVLCKPICDGNGEKPAMTENSAHAEFDVVILGSGAAGLTAALTTSQAGMRTLILEKSDKIGGTSAMSGAGTWVPANHIMLSKGLADSPENALQYIKAVMPEAWGSRESDRWQAFTTHAPDMLKMVDDLTPIEWEVLSEPDPVLEAPGAVKYGRMLSPAPMKLKAQIGDFARKLRPSTQPHDLTYEEMNWANFIHKPIIGHLKHATKILKRKLLGFETQGSALIAGLLKGCLDHGCELISSAAATDLIKNETGQIRAVTYRQNDQTRTVATRHGVVIATGGFEWDADLFGAHFPKPPDLICSPRTNTGDGQKLARAVGAELAYMGEANIAGALPTKYEGHVHGMPLRFQADRHVIVVDQTGHRFGNEFDFNFGELLLRKDADTGTYPHLPAWVIGDANWIRNTPIIPFYARNQKNWLIKSTTLSGLAEKLDLSAEALDWTIERFNTFARQGADEDFGRGKSGFDKLVSGKRGTMAPIERPPYYAAPFNISLMGTKGGPMTDACGRVLRPDASFIPGLFAAGNAMANPFGTRAVGTGTTIGPAMTWGYICGLTLSKSEPYQA